MPFKFSIICQLLDKLEINLYRKRTTIARAQNPDVCLIRQWFNNHENLIPQTGCSAVALLSTLFPERRVDRVYNLQEKRLSAIFGRALGLGNSRLNELNQWRERDGADFATCLERVMAQSEFDPPSANREVTVEEVDAALHQIAANSPFSSSDVRQKANQVAPDDILRPILHRLQSREARWFVCLILKSFGAIQIPEHETLHLFHFMLPDLLKVQNSFEAAVKVLGKAEIVSLPPRPNKQYEKALKPLVAREIVPILGVMIRRQPYDKARSIKHCNNIAAGRDMSVERKYDGEYCQIHVDLMRNGDRIQIFSKSGKDSTNDRIGLHTPIKNGLQLDRAGCKIHQNCIVEGELVVWSTQTRSILPFHMIRRHVKHGGKYLGTARDSPAKHTQQLMIVFYDLLLLDNQPILHEAHTIRRNKLKELVKTIEGQSILGERILLQFGSKQASISLREHFTTAILNQWEGLVLKPCDESFLSWQRSTHGIKLKKDYMKGCGDSADLCILGGRRCARTEQQLHLGPLRWTSFFVGCLTNKTEVERFQHAPNFTIIDELTSHSMPREDLLHLNNIGKLVEIPYQIQSRQHNIFMARSDMSKPSELFTMPLIVEIMGAGFDKPSNCSFYTLRFPRKIGPKIKLHHDRTILETTTFDELQEMAEASMMATDKGLSDEADWIEKMLQADGKEHSSLISTPERADTASFRSPESPSSATHRDKKGPSGTIQVHADTPEVDYDTVLDSVQPTHDGASRMHDSLEVAERGSEMAREPLAELSDGNQTRIRKRQLDDTSGWLCKSSQKKRKLDVRSPKLSIPSFQELQQPLSRVSEHAEPTRYSQDRHSTTSVQKFRKRTEPLLSSGPNPYKVLTASPVRLKAADDQNTTRLLSPKYVASKVASSLYLAAPLDCIHRSKKSVARLLHTLGNSGYVLCSTLEKWVTDIDNTPSHSENWRDLNLMLIDAKNVEEASQTLRRLFKLLANQVLTDIQLSDLSTEEERKSCNAPIRYEDCIYVFDYRIIFHCIVDGRLDGMAIIRSKDDDDSCLRDMCFGVVKLDKTVWESRQSVKFYLEKNWSASMMVEYNE